MPVRIATITAALSGSLLLAAAALAAPATAEPGMPNCGALFMVCDLLPIAPDLDHDVDMTTQLPPADALPDAPMADPCALGCV